MDLTIAVNDDIYNIFKLKSLLEIQQEKAEVKSLSDKYLTPTSSFGCDLSQFSIQRHLERGFEHLRHQRICCLISSLISVYLGGLTEERGILKLLQVINLLRAKHTR